MISVDMSNSDRLSLQCRELYFCVKEAMEKAASRNSARLPGI